MYIVLLLFYLYQRTHQLSWNHVLLLLYNISYGIPMVLIRVLILAPLLSWSYNLLASEHIPSSRNRIWSHQKNMHWHQKQQEWLCLAINTLGGLILLLISVSDYYCYEYSNYTLLFSSILKHKTVKNHRLFMIF